jgi:polyisoprenoid-binding protein YceI
MRLRLTGLCGFLVLAGATARAEAADWRVEPARSTVTVEVNQDGRPLTGRFERFAAEIRFDPNDLAGSRAVITVDLASFRTGDSQRDQIAASQEFLGATGQPQARYATRAFKALGGGRYEVTADLALKGVTRSLTHPATITIVDDEARATGEVVLARSEFGVGARQFPRGDQVGLAVTVRFDLVAARGG